MGDLFFFAGSECMEDSATRFLMHESAFYAFGRNADAHRKKIKKLFRLGTKSLDYVL